MQDRLSARLTGARLTGNGPRESYAHAPMPRMTNTFLLAGPYQREEIIASVKPGLYAHSFWIENGRLAYPVSEVTIAGNLGGMIQDIEAVANDLVFLGPVCSSILKIGNIAVSGE